MLYQYNPQLSQAYLIDFQIARYASPACDITHYIFGTTLKEMRDQHYDDFLKIYHESLSFQLHRLGSDPEKLFPYHVFQQQLRKFGRFGLFNKTISIPVGAFRNFLPISGLIMAVFMMQVLENDNLKDVDDMAKDLSDGNLSENFTKSPKAHKRLRDIVADMVRLKYI